VERVDRVAASLDSVGTSSLGADDGFVFFEDADLVTLVAGILRDVLSVDSVVFFAAARARVTRLAGLTGAMTGKVRRIVDLELVLSRRRKL